MLTSDDEKMEYASKGLRLKFKPSHDGIFPVPIRSFALSAKLKYGLSAFYQHSSGLTGNSSNTISFETIPYPNRMQKMRTIHTKLP